MHVEVMKRDMERGGEVVGGEKEEERWSSRLDPLSEPRERA